MMLHFNVYNGAVQMTKPVIPPNIPCDDVTGTSQFKFAV